MVSGVWDLKGDGEEILGLFVFLCLHMCLHFNLFVNQMSVTFISFECGSLGILIYWHFLKHSLVTEQYARYTFELVFGEYENVIRSQTLMYKLWGKLKSSENTQFIIVQVQLEVSCLKLTCFPIRDTGREVMFLPEPWVSALERSSRNSLRVLLRESVAALLLLLNAVGASQTHFSTGGTGNLKDFVVSDTDCTS
jgi:hypothetical protein